MKKKNLNQSSKLDISAPLSKSKNNSGNGIVRKVLVPVSIIGCFIMVSMIVASIVSIAMDDKLTEEMNLLRKQEAERKANGGGGGAVLLSTHSQDKQQQQQLRQLPEVGRDTLILSTKYGDIKIKLRPDLSQESVDHIRQLAASTNNCQICQFYRSEKDLLLQGIMRPDTTSVGSAVLPKGQCPPDYANAKKQDCPPHDPNCACHGPTMTKGMVGWAGGGTGPDFFINVFHKPVDWWGQQHTVWGIVEDPKSLELIESTILRSLPTQKAGIMWMLKERIDFTMTMMSQQQ